MKHILWIIRHGSYLMDLPLEAIPARVSASGRFNQVRQISEEGPVEIQHLVLQFGGWGVGGCPPPRKNKHVMETTIQQLTLLL